MAAPKIVTGPQPRDPDKFGPLGQPHTLVTHHGEGQRDRDDGHGLAILAGYNRFHDQPGSEDHDWGGIAYHFAILRSGTIVKLRPVRFKGAHSPPNAGRVGVVLPGDYDTGSPTTAQMASLCWLWTSGVLIPAGLALVTHRERNATSCPGDRLQTAVVNLRHHPPRPKPEEKPVSTKPKSKAWHTDPRKVQRIRRHLDWFYRHHAIAPPKGFRVTGPKLDDPLKAAIKDVKDLLGYLKRYQTWAASLNDPKAFNEFIDRIHHPSRVGPEAQKRGIDRRRERKRPKLTGVQELAQAVLDHPGLDLTCYSSPTGGTAAVGLREIVKDGTAYVHSPEAADQGRTTRANVNVLNFLLDLGDANRANPACITCIVNGDHSEDSEHYDFEAVDVDKNAGGTNRIYQCAAANAMTCLDEDSAHYHVHDRD